MDFLIEEETARDRTKSHSIWCEKYRPVVLDDYIGNEAVKESCKIYLEKQDIPHLLFFGPAGTGKTSLAKLLSKNIQSDVMYINASSERGIDTTRDKIQDFARGAGFRPLKILILDESDYLTYPAQASLRNMMETYSVHTRFILTCNYFEKMIPALISRCQTFEIKPLSKSEVAKKLVQILQKENVTFIKEDIKFIVETYYPDIRKVINFAQQSNVRGEIKIAKENVMEVDFLNKIISIVKDSTNPSVSFNQIRQLVTDHADPESLENVFRYLMDHVEEYAKGKEAAIVLRLAEGLKQSAILISKVRDIPFLACMYNILNDLKK